jgi:hypothetical protein
MKTMGLILTFNIILICIGIIAWFRVHLTRNHALLINNLHKNVRDNCFLTYICSEHSTGKVFLLGYISHYTTLTA